uniref:Uncharacterized protein n=1 Tax=Triticum urartu TaxID=4572 RepID=A0A8R7R9Z5_TRIUA
MGLPPRPWTPSWARSRRRPPRSLCSSASSPRLASTPTTWWRSPARTRWGSRTAAPSRSGCSPRTTPPWTSFSPATSSSLARGSRWTTSPPTTSARRTCSTTSSTSTCSTGRASSPPTRTCTPTPRPSPWSLGSPSTKPPSSTSSSSPW